MPPWWLLLIIISRRKRAFLALLRRVWLAPAPILLYNVPARTAVNMLPKPRSVWHRIATTLGIKEAEGGIVSQIDLVIKQAPKTFAYLQATTPSPSPYGTRSRWVISGNWQCLSTRSSAHGAYDAHPPRAYEALKIHHYFRELSPTPLCRWQPRSKCPNGTTTCLKRYSAYH